MHAQVAEDFFADFEQKKYDIDDFSRGLYDFWHCRLAVNEMKAVFKV